MKSNQGWNALFRKLRLRQAGSVVLSAALIGGLSSCSQEKPGGAGPTNGPAKPAAEAKPPGPPPGSIEIPLTYRGLTADTNDFSASGYWGFQAPTNNEAPFLKAVSAKKEVLPVHNPYFKGREFAAVEMQEGKPVALYFDANANGQAEDNERIPAVRETALSAYTQWFFVTPDFELASGESKVKFRAVLQALAPRGGAQTVFSWSPACVLEGRAKVGAEEMALALFADGFTGAFDHFGQGKFSLFPAELTNRQFVTRQTLSSLAQLNQNFYRLSLAGRGPDGHPTKLLLCPETNLTGRVALTLEGCTGTNTGWARALLAGASDPNLRLELENLSALPGGSYRLENGTVRVEQQATNWWFSFGQGPAITISNETRLTLGHPQLRTRVRDANQGPAEAEKTTFAKGTWVVITASLPGAAGELWERFRFSGADAPAREISPQVLITDEAGKEILAQAMVRGAASVFEARWNTAGLPAGAYAIKVSQETGPLAGLIESPVKVTIE